MTKVFVRPRPLAQAEAGDSTINYLYDADHQNVTIGDPSIATAKRFSHFAGVLSPSNDKAFAVALHPLLPDVLTGATVCCFAYGYTNSGKTHTIFGYLGDTGLCQRAVAELVAGSLVQIRFYELYNDKVYDLLNHRTPGFVREDADGVVHVRSETTTGPNGEVLTQSLRAEYAASLDEAVAIISRGMQLRAAGTSELHSQSSRSHAVLEIELVTEELAQARRELVEAKSRVVPAGKARDDLHIAIQSKLYVQGQDGKYAPTGAQPSAEEETTLAALGGQLRVLEEVVEEIQRRVHAARAACPGGTMVFVDLAGAEYTGKGLSRSAKELKEAREINTSLLALKECIRAQNTAGRSHIPYRNSKLTMLLKSYLAPQLIKATTTTTTTTTVMVATVSSAASQQPKAEDTIKYASLVAQALQAQGQEKIKTR